MQWRLSWGSKIHRMLYIVDLCANALTGYTVELPGWIVCVFWPRTRPHVTWVSEWRRDTAGWFWVLWFRSPWGTAGPPLNCSPSALNTTQRRLFISTRIPPHRYSASHTLTCQDVCVSRSDGFDLDDARLCGLKTDNKLTWDSSQENTERKLTCC